MRLVKGISPTLNPTQTPRTPKPMILNTVLCDFLAGFTFDYWSVLPLKKEKKNFEHIFLSWLQQRGDFNAIDHSWNRRFSFGCRGIDESSACG